MPSASSATDSFASVVTGLLLLLGEGAASGFVALLVLSLSLLESGAVDSLESSEVLSTSDSAVSDADVFSSAVLGGGYGTAGGGFFCNRLYSGYGK